MSSTGKSRFISGIHDYCDRWCERCQFTPRCRVFHDSERDRQRHVERGEDPNSAGATAHDVGRALAKVHRLLARFARREGLNLDELAHQSHDKDPQSRNKTIEGASAARDEQAKACPIVGQTDEFMLACRDFLEKLRVSFDSACDEIRQRGGFMDVAGEATLLGRIRESYEVLCWDHTLIPVKLRRAIDATQQADSDPEFRDLHQRDAAGSGAVARRALQRTQAALLAIYDWDEALRDDVIGLLAMAERLLRALEREIPECVKFTWPPPEAEAELEE